MNNSKRFLIIGMGRFGQALADTLTQEGAEVLAVDARMELLDRVKDRVALAAQLDATDVEALRGIQADNVTAAIVAIGEQFEAAVLCVAALKDAGVTTILARARTPMQARILLAVGAAQVLEIEAEMGRRLGASLAAGAFLPPAKG